MNRLLLWPALLAMPAAQAITLDFGQQSPAPTICTAVASGLGPLVSCGDGSYLSQTYGDLAGVVDVTYSAPRLSGESLHWWSTDYNTLYGVAWAGGGDANSLGRIELKPVVSGEVVTLQSFDLGAWPNSARGSTVTVYAIGGGTALFSWSGTVGQSGNLPTHFTPGVSSATGLWIEWRDSAYNVGIDNIHYTVGAVPEPAAWLSLAAGLVGLAGWARRRPPR
ncbi:MAG: PEP-CTERM sorting domain-containing protein [Burkholderiales bacterium PBB5]|nr:MAG: PEP-CTERM sorting domain-containing protein [Burkholderiales bacterium PBB5]